MAQAKPLTFSLRDDWMGIFERAGLAGLYLTLQGIDGWADAQDDRNRTDTCKGAQKVKRLFQPWNLSSPDTLDLRWNTKDERKPLTELVRWAWQVREGVFFLPGIHRSLIERNNRFLRVPTHNGILATFLQHNKVRPKLNFPERDDDGNGPVVEIDQGKTITIPRFPEIRDSFKDKKGKKRPNTPKQTAYLIERMLPMASDRPATLSGAFYPGTAPRFGTDQNWTGSRQAAFLLLFAPIACLYLELPRNRITLKSGKKAVSQNWALIIPPIEGLPSFAESRRRLQERVQARFDQIKVNGPHDALLRVSVEYATRPQSTIFACFMGRTSYQRKDNSLSKIQMVRKQSVAFRPADRSLERYKKVIAYLKTIPVPRKDGSDGKATHWLRDLYGRGRISLNLAEGNPWYADLHIPTEWERDGLEAEREQHNTKEGQERDKKSEMTFIFYKLSQRETREALMALANDRSMYDCPETEMAFRDAFHDMMATLFWQEREAIKSRLRMSEDDTLFKEKLEKREEDLVDKLRRSFVDAQTRELLRQAVAEWFSKGGRHETIRAYRNAIWEFINHPRKWRQARDLALLAIVTYEPREPNKQTTGGKP